MSLKRKLQRLKGHLTLEQSNGQDKNSQTEFLEANKVQEQKELCEESQIIEHNALTREILFLEEWAALNTKLFYYEDQYALVREVSYPLDKAFGKYQFQELKRVVELWNKRRVSHPLSAHSFDAQDLFFFDTETTGLGGGTGNTIFLLGYCQVLEEQVRVKQFFLPDPSAEIALYQAFLADIQYMKRLVTYNGKAFDWPQVKTRHTLIREWLPKLPSFGHFDLLHASRRLWKNSLPSCRLSVVEKEILDVHREGDTPGYLAPMLYFDYLHSQNPAIIEGVLKHNEWDVCSLISLYIHISQILMQNRSISNAQELYEVGRWYEAVGEIGEAIQVYQKVAQAEGRYSDEGKHALALLYKKTKQYDLACELWEELSRRKETVEADIELAKLYEHQFRDYEKALFYASKAFQTWKKRASVVRRTNKQEQREWQKRLERLEMKVLYVK